MHLRGAGRRARVGARITALLLLGAALASCTTTARVTDVYMALDGNGSRRRTVFFTDTKEIHCIVEAGISRKGATLEAIVRELQGYDFVADKFFATDRVVVNVEASPQPAEGIQRADVMVNPQAPDGSDAAGAPFLPGHFQCEVYLDGSLAEVAVFNVDFPDCPTASIRPKTTCFGFYKQNTQCPKYGVASHDSAQCRCSTTKGWECDL